MQLSHIKEKLSYARSILEDLEVDSDLEYNIVEYDSASGSDEIDDHEF